MLIFLGNKIGARIHVFEALPRLFDSAKAMGAARTEFQGCAPRLAFLFELPSDWQDLTFSQAQVELVAGKLYFLLNITIDCMCLFYVVGSRIDSRGGGLMRLRMLTLLW
jgi:hypothetical protein